MARSGTSKTFLVILLLFIFAGVARILLPFTGPLVSALVLGISFHPLHQKIHQGLRRRHPTLAALFSDIVILLFLILPVGLLIWGLVAESARLTPVIRKWHTTLTALHEGQPIETGPVGHLRYWLMRTWGVGQEQFQQNVGQFVDRFLQSVSSIGAIIAKNTVSLLFDLLILLLTLFFVFRDGARMMASFRKYLPLKEDQKIDLIDKVRLTIDGVIRGWFITALIQGVTATLGYYVAHIPAAALLGFLTAVVGLLPSVGTALLWLPIGVVQLVRHQYFSGGFVLGWGVLVVGLMDNLLRPYLVGNKAELPFLYLFFGILGGVEVWGPSGIIIGPLIVALAPMLLEMCGELYLIEPEKEREEESRLHIAHLGERHH